MADKEDLSKKMGQIKQEVKDDAHIAAQQADAAAQKVKAGYHKAEQALDDMNDAIQQAVHKGIEKLKED